MLCHKILKIYLPLKRRVDHHHHILGICLFILFANLNEIINAITLFLCVFY